MYGKNTFDTSISFQINKTAVLSQMKTTGAHKKNKEYKPVSNYDLRYQ